MPESPATEPGSAFYFDLASPLAYLAAESILHVLPGPVEWQPVLARELSPTAESFAKRCENELEALRGCENELEALRGCENELEALREDLARRARELGLQPLRLPSDFPFDSEQAMRVATYAKSIGRTVPFAQAAFRQAFAGGSSLAPMDNVLIAAAACEMHPAAVLKGAELTSVRQQLAGATAQATRAGVSDVPAVRIGERVFVGEHALEQAREHRHDSEQSTGERTALP